MKPKRMLNKGGAVSPVRGSDQPGVFQQIVGVLPVRLLTLGIGFNYFRRTLTDAGQRGVIVGQMQHHKARAALHQGADRRSGLTLPRMRSPSQCPGTARSAASAGRSLMLTMSRMRVRRAPACR